MKGYLGIILGGIIGFLPGILIGALVVTGVGYYETGGTQIPFNLQHNAIAAKVSVVVDGKNCDLKHLESTLAPFYPQDLRNIAKFAKSTGNLPMSVWGFVQSGNVQVIMSIIGPPTDNDTIYVLEFGRLTSASVEIQGPSFVPISWIERTTNGYAMVDISYP